MTEPALLGVDWGSSSIRVFAIAADGAILDVRRAGDGVFTGEGAFAARLNRHLGDWLERFAKIPILLCGMVGSDRGWVPAPYVPAPASLRDLARALVPAPFPRSAHIVPGVSLLSGDSADVMRGEETLLMGLLAGAPQPPRQTVCLPGTHSKWAELESDRIARFRTYMTGELRALVLAQGTLAVGVPQTRAKEAFERGLRAAGGGVTQALFQARAGRLLDVLAPEHTDSFVSGVLVGAEVASEAGSAPLTLAARGELAEAYAAALDAAGLAHAIADPESAAALGLLAIARAAGLA